MSNLAVTATAQPILASTLYDAIEQARRGKTTASRNRQMHDGQDERERLQTGRRNLDRDVLGGGLGYGRGGLVGICGEDAVELAISTLTTHLLKPFSGPAFIIDTFNAFSPISLHRHLRARVEATRLEAVAKLTHTGGFVYERRANREMKELEMGIDRESEDIRDAGKEADAAMDRVALMRVFDFEGVMEALAEVGERLNGLVAGAEVAAVQIRNEPRQEDQEHVKEGASSVIGIDNTGLVQQKQSENLVPKRLEIADSEGEEDEDEEMLDDIGISDTTTSPSIPAIAQHTIEGITNTTPSEAVALNEQQQPDTQQPLQQHKSAPQKQEEKPTMLILTNLSRALGPLMRHNHIQGHALLVHFMRTLTQLTLTHPICCILLYTTVGGPSTIQQVTAGQSEGLDNDKSRRRGELLTGGDRSRGSERERQEEATPSVFAENGTLRPALGRTFAQFLDLSLMVSRVGRSGSVEKRKGLGNEVIEVLSDRHEGRLAKWCILG